MKSSFCLIFVSLSYLLETIVSCIIDRCVLINQRLMKQFYATIDGLFLWHTKYPLSPTDAAISLTVT
jgi:hypothetical protein